MNTGKEIAVLELPKNFEKLSESKQRQIVINEILSLNMHIANAADTVAQAKQTARALKKLIDGSKQGRELDRQKKEASKAKRVEDDLLAQRTGAITMAKRLGIDVSEAISNMKKLTEMN